MEEAIFPPCPSWFLPNILASREDGSVSYGSKSNIVILKVVEEKTTETLIIQNAHSQRVTGVAFSPTNCDASVQNTIVSCAEDGLVKMWKIDTLAAFMCNKSHWADIKVSKEMPGKVISVDWSKANPNHIVSAAENNTLVLWDVLKNTTVRFTFQKLGATVIACCPYNEKIVAVGGKTGQIYIINLNGEGEVIYRLRGHDNKIQSLSWCPVPYNVFEENGVYEEFLLASACQDKEIYIWRAGSNGKCEVKFHSPTSSILKKDQYHGKLGNSFSYTALFWCEPFRLYLSSNFCELLYFDIKQYLLNKAGKGTTSGQKSNKQLLNSIKLGHFFHTKGLFAIAGTPSSGEVMIYDNTEIKSELKFKIESNKSKITVKSKDESEMNLKWEVVLSNSSSLLWTAGQDRKLVACRRNSSQLEMVFNYHTMNGYVYCAVVSPHDPNKIAIGVGDGMIRLWNLTEPSGDIQMYWQKIKDRVMTLAWHPTKDGILAYGTSEGRVGLIDTNSNKLPSVFKPSHPQPIYNLSWGPQFPSEDSGVPTSKSEFDLYSVGDNKLFLYSPSKLSVEPLNLSRIISFPCKKQTDVCWKPDYSLLAVGNEDGSICMLEPKEFKIVYTLFAYKKLIQSISWHPSSTSLDSGLSPYEGYFASASTDKDCEIRVFNCIKEENQVKVEKAATLKGHHGHIQSVSWSPHISCRLISTSTDGSVQIWDVVSQVPLVNFTPKGMPLFSTWSPIDSDIVLTGCRNDILSVWRVSAQTEISPGPCAKTKKQKKKKSFQMSSPKEISAGNGETPEMVDENGIEDVAVAEAKVTSKCKEVKMFSKAWKGEGNDELKTCYDLLKGESGEVNYSLSFLRGEDCLKELIKDEGEKHKKANKSTEFYELSLWDGSIKEVLEEKIKNGDLNDFLVSLAPVISPRVWQEACLSYSKSLAEKKLFRKAASYLIVCHKIYEAIHLLVDANLYAEALCIASSRLPKSDPVIDEIVRKYADWLFKNGSFLKACECYIYLQDYLEVAKICGKKNQAEYLSLAAFAAKKCGASDLESLEATNAVFKCFEANNFELARRVCDDHDNLKHLRLIHSMYHVLTQLDGEELVLEKDIISHVREFCETDVIFPDSLQHLYHKYVFYKKLRQVYIIVAQELSFAACAKNAEEVITHLIKSLSTCYRYISSGENIVHPLYKLCCWLSPNGFLTDNIYFTSKDSLLAPKVKSLRAFLCAAIVRNLNDQKTEDASPHMDMLNELKDDLLDEDSYKYFKNLIEVEVCENRLMTNRNKVTRSKMTNGINQESPVVNGASQTDSNKINGVESFENEPAESSTSETGSESNVDNLEKSPREIEENSREGVNGTSVGDLEEKIINDLDLLNRLKREIESFETSRISAPNPVPVYSMLKRLCEGVSQKESAKFLLEDLEKKWQRLN